MKTNTIRIGIIGTGRIAGRFVSETEFVDYLLINSVFNPRREGVLGFCNTYNLPNPTCDLEEFFEMVDAVYIASPHEFHGEYAALALEHGKHVLCEKPMIFNKNEAKKLFGFARKKGLVLMEAVKTAYLPGFTGLMEDVKSGIIGKIYDVEAAFTKLVDPKMREYTARFGGSFTELASYPMTAVFSVLGTKYNDISFKSFKNDDGVDIYTKAHIHYPGAVATLKTGIGVKSEGSLTISGDKGYIFAKSPWWLTRSYEICFEDVSKNIRRVWDYEGDGLRYEIAAFLKRIKGEEIPGFWNEEYSLKSAEIFESFLEG